MVGAAVWFAAMLRARLSGSPAVDSVAQASGAAAPVASAKALLLADGRSASGRSGRRNLTAIFGGPAFLISPPHSVCPWLRAQALLIHLTRIAEAS